MIDFLKKMLARPKPDDFRQRDLGLEAERLWNDQAFQRAADNVRMGIVERWMGSPLEDLEGQKSLRLMLKLHDDLMGNIRKEMSNGTVATAKIKAKQETDRKSKEVIQFRR